MDTLEHAILQSRARRRRADDQPHRQRPRVSTALCARSVMIWLVASAVVATWFALSRAAGDPLANWLLGLYAIGALAFARVQRRLSQRVSRLGTLVLTDALSGCLNLRGFERAAARAVRSSDPLQSPLALVALDLDGFKAINDQFGHAAGDAVIRETAAILRAHVRSGDLVARLGGEEFGIILPDTPLPDAEALAHRLVEAVRVATWPALPGRRVTISAGVAMCDASSPHALARLRSRADAALYTAKRQGRDRVCTSDHAALSLWRPTPPPEHAHPPLHATMRMP